MICAKNISGTVNEVEMLLVRHSDAIAAAQACAYGEFCLDQPTLFDSRRFRRHAQLILSISLVQDFHAALAIILVITLRASTQITQPRQHPCGAGARVGPIRP